MNYTALKQAIQDTTQNYETTFVASLDLFIQRAERRIYQEAKIPATRKNSTGVTVIGNRSLALPTDYINVKAIEITTATGVVNLLPKSAEYLTEMYPVAATQAQPKFWAHYDETTVQLAPTPDLAYTVGFHYFAVPTSITTAVSGTTWLGNNFDQVLFYAALLEAYIFMKGSADVMQMYMTAYTTGLTELKAVVANMKLQDFRE